MVAAEQDVQHRQQQEFQQRRRQQALARVAMWTVDCSDRQLTIPVIVTGLQYRENMTDESFQCADMCLE